MSVGEMMMMMISNLNRDVDLSSSRKVSSRGRNEEEVIGW
jgi:hypothetical protein